MLKFSGSSYLISDQVFGMLTEPNSTYIVTNVSRPQVYAVDVVRKRLAQYAQVSIISNESLMLA
jgi:hypothetical protein